MNENRQPRWEVSVFRSKRRNGPWRMGERVRAMAIFGNLTLDLRDFDANDSDTEVVVVALFGDVRMVVREGASVELSGVSVFGDRRSVASGRGSPAGTHVRVRGTAVFGDVEVLDSVVASS